MQRGLSFAVAFLAVACGGQPSRGPTPVPAASSSPKGTSYTELLRARAHVQGELTLVPRIQAAAESAVLATGKAGAVVVLSPETGAVSALFSVAGDRGDPLLTAHRPASTFKSFTALAGLEAGVLTPNTERDCTGKHAFAGKELRCSKAHGHETTREAVARSCNVFFYLVGEEMDHARLYEIARRFGFGTRTGIELPDDAGLVPDQTRYDEIKRDPGSTVPLLDAIGHGEITVTLLQLARAYAVFASGGKVLGLTLAQAQPGRPAVALSTLEFRPEHLELIRGALVDTVAAADGTAHSVSIPGLDFAAKTGSDDAPPRPGSTAEDEDTLFVAYAPPEAPSVVVAVRIERSEPGRDAKTAGRQVLEVFRAGF